MSTRDIFKENLKFYRKQKGLSQEKLSELIGYGGTYITEIESRNKFPKPETIDLIAEKLEIEPYQLFQKNGCPENIKNYSQSEFIAELSDKLCFELSQTLQAEISKGISKAFNAQ